MQQQQQQQQQVDPNVIPRYKARSFLFKLGDAPSSDQFDSKVATDWLNDQVLAGWGLVEFNKMFVDGTLIFIIIVGQLYRRKVAPATEEIPTEYQQRM